MWFSWSMTNLSCWRSRRRCWMTYGCETVTAASGKEALEKLATDQRIEILITDINMPGMDGYALAKSATQMREDLKIIVLSGRASGGNRFPLIRKPFLERDLKKAMAEHTGLC